MWKVRGLFFGSSFPVLFLVLFLFSFLILIFSPFNPLCKPLSKADVEFARFPPDKRYPGPRYRPILDNEHPRL